MIIVATRTTKKTDGETTRKTSSTNGKQESLAPNWATIGAVLVIAAFTILAVATLILLGQTYPENNEPSKSVDLIPQKRVATGSTLSQHGESSDLIDASSGELKSKLIYMRKHNPSMYTEIRDVWRRKQGMGQMDPFEAAADIGRDWDQCYSDSFDGTWMC